MELYLYNAIIMESHNVFLGFYFVRCLPDPFDPMRNSFFKSNGFPDGTSHLCDHAVSKQRTSVIPFQFDGFISIYCPVFLAKISGTMLSGREERRHHKEKSSQRLMLLFGVFTVGFSNGLNKFSSLQGMVRALVTK